MTVRSNQQGNDRVPGSADSGLPVASIEDASGERRLIVGGAVQSVAVANDETPRGYWRALVPRRRPTNALILGLGGGTIVHLLWRRFGAVRIVGVDDDPALLALARSHLGLDPEIVSIIITDAFAFVRRCTEQFDLVVVDLYRGETLAGFASSGSFQRRVQTLVKPGGTLVWNLHRDRRSASLRHKVGRGLERDLRIRAGLNLILHARRRQRRRSAAHIT